MGCFGRTGGQSEKGKSSTTTYIDSLSPEQKKYFNKLLDLYGPQAGVNKNIYPGDRVADFTPLQNTAVSMANNYADIFSTPKTVGTPLFTETGNAINDLLSGKAGAQKTTPEQVNQYFTERIQAPAMKLLEEDLLPAVDEGYTGGNFWSAARGKARDKMTSDIADKLIEQRSQLEWDTNLANQNLDEADAARMLSALSPAMSYGQMPYQEALHNLTLASGGMSGLANLFGMGSSQQEQQQKEIDAEIGKFTEEHQITDPDNLAILMNLLNMDVMRTSKENAYFWRNQYENSWKAGDWGSFALQAAALGALGGI